MNLGIRFHDTESLPFEERVAAVRRQGFGCVHLALSKAFEPFAGPDALTPGFAMHIKNAFARNELDIAVLGCYLNLLHPDARELADIQSAYRAHLQFASWLGCGMVGTETGCPNADYRHEPACHTEECFAQFAKNLEPVVADAERLGVTVGIEPVYSHSIYSPRRARQLLDAMRSPNLKIILDPVNLLCAANAHRHRDIVDEALDLLGGDVAVLHLKDFTVEEDTLRSVPAGFGRMDYAGLMRFVKRCKPHIHATLEDAPPECAAEALERMRLAYGQA